MYINAKSKEMRRWNFKNCIGYYCWRHCSIFFIIWHL